MLLELTQNLAFLVALAVGLRMLARRLEENPRLYGLTTGLLFGVVGVAGMMTPMHFAPGVIYDGRSIVLSLGGLFGGPMAAVLAAMMCGAYRLHLGGAGATAGVGTIIEAAALGIALHYLRRRDEAWVGPARLWAFALLVHVIMLALQFLVPNKGWEVMQRVGPAVLLFYPLGFLLIAQVFLDGERRRKSEEALRVSELKYRELVESANSIILRMDHHGNVLFFNEYAQRFFGYSEEEILGRNVVGTIVPELESSGRDLRAMVLDIVRHTDHYTANENENRRKNGEIVWVAWTNKAVPGADPRVSEILCVGQDITERKRAEEALRESGEDYQQLFEAESDAIFLIDNESGQILRVNHAACVMYGYTHDELLSLRNVDLSAEPDQTQKVTRGTPPDSDRVVAIPLRWHRKKDGTPFPVEISGRFFVRRGRPVHIAAMRPISERLELEAAQTFLLQCGLPGTGEDFFASLARYLAKTLDMEYICIDLLEGDGLNAQTVAVYNEGRFETNLRYALKDTPCGAVVDKGICCYPQGVRHLFPQDEALQELRAESYFGTTLMDSKGRPIGLIALIGHRPLENPKRAESLLRLVGPRAAGELERRQAEAALREGETRYSMTLAAVNDGFWEWHVPSGKAVFSPIYYAMLGYENEEFPATYDSWRALVHPEDLDRVEHDLQRSIEKNEGFAIDLRMKTKSGEWLWVSTRGRSVEQDAEGKTVRMLGTLSDIDERKRLEDQLRQAQKMESVGRLAGGVAHDFNNILQVILTNADLVQDTLAPGTPAREAIDEVSTAARRAADLVRQLLAFSRRQIIQPVNVDLNDLIQGVLKMLRRVIGEHIRLHFVPGERLATVFVDKGQIEQVLMNLCVNARDAMPRGGTLSIETEDVTLDAEFCRDHPWASEGRYSLVSVTDTGHGMDPATCARIFEPFFTTKGVGEGTGLGLATVYGVVKHHKGLIHVYSEPDTGTAFKVYLPAATGPEEDTGLHAAEPVTGGRETILVAEDEPTVLKLITMILRHAGYTVLATADGHEALRVFEEYAGGIDLVLLDVMMPGLSGNQVMEQIREKHHGVRFLFSSGYSESTIHADFVIQEKLHLIQKPYSKAALLREVRQVLDEPKAATETS